MSLSRFLCCVSLKTGTLIISTLNLVASVFFTFQYSFLLVAMINQQSDYQDRDSTGSVIPKATVWNRVDLFSFRTYHLRISLGDCFHSEHPVHGLPYLWHQEGTFSIVYGLT